MDRTQALRALKQEYQLDYQNEIRAARDLLASGIRGMRGPEGVLNLDNRESFVALGQARKKFVEQLERAVKPLLDNYARELEQEAANLGLDGQGKASDPLMESLHNALRNLQASAQPAPSRPVQPQAAPGSNGQRN